MLKRFFDIIMSVVALLIFAIPIIIIVMMIKLKEKHPVIFKQQRIGLNKKPFDILKFQTMVDDIPTNTGRFLRKTGLDEIPQFINVLKGDMSIIGPRAQTADDIKRLKWDDSYHIMRWSIRPGISGLAQLYGGQNKKTSWFWDKKYVQHSNLLTDFIIIVLSFAMNILGKTWVRNLIWKRKNLK